MVGAGIGGLTLACALRDSDWEIDVVERAERVGALGVGIVLHPNGMRVLDTLGLVDEVAHRGNALRRLEIARGDQTRVIELADAWPGARHPTTAIRRSDLHDVLARAAAEQPGSVRIRAGTRLDDLDAGPRRPVASFAGAEQQEYDVVVGADGVHSTVRRLLYPGAHAVRTGLYYTRFVAEAVDGLDAGTWHTTEGKNVAHGAIPLGCGRAHYFVQLSELPDSVAADEQPPQWDVDVLRSWDPALADALARAEDPHRGFAHLVQPVAWGDGACVLLGDAAHAVSPTLSQGGSLAAEDAVVLARCLRAAEPRVAISAYRSARHQRTLWAYRMSLAQVNGLALRTTPRWTIDTEAAIRHLAQIYEPLLADPLAAVGGLSDSLREV